MAKSDCSVLIFRENVKIFKDLIWTVGLPITSFTVSGDNKKNSENILKKKKKKKNSENDQKLVIFRAFLFIYFLRPTLNLEKIM